MFINIILKYLKRIILIAGPILFVFNVYKLNTLTSNEYAKYLDTDLNETIMLCLGIYMFYYVWAVAYSIFDITKNRRPNWYLWIPFVVLGFFVGPYVYYETFVFNNYSIIPPQIVHQSISEWSSPEISFSQYMVRRLLAFTIDYGIFLICIVFTTILFGQRTLNGWNLHDPIVLVWLPILWLILFPVSEGLFGKTLGKLITKIRVVNYSGQTITLPQGFRRRFMDLFDILFYSILFIITTSKVNTIPRRFGDKYAKTVVVPHNYTITLS